MTPKQKNTIGYIAVLLFFGIWGTIAIMRQRQLSRDHVQGLGKIYRYNAGGRGNAGGIWIDYSYDVDGKKYTGSSNYSLDKIDIGIVKKYLLGNTFPIVYNPKYPGNSHLLITRQDFVKFGYNYPDSLKRLPLSID
jgi:hypothetical protein